MTRSKTNTTKSQTTNTTGTDIPSYVDIGPYRLKIELVDDPGQYLKIPAGPDVDMFGCFRLIHETIYVCKHLKPVSMADTLLHEILHAVWTVGTGSSGGALEEEEVVSMMSTLMLDVIKKNPQLIKYIGQV